MEKWIRLSATAQPSIFLRISSFIRGSEVSSFTRGFVLRQGFRFSSGVPSFTRGFAFRRGFVISSEGFVIRPVLGFVFRHARKVSSKNYNSATENLSSNSHFTISDLSDSNYHRISDATMEHILEFLENLNDQLDFDGFDVEYSSGVLTLKCGLKGTYVINKQPPNKQIWLSSPISGPKRYDYDLVHKKWFYHRDNTTLDELLNNELSTIFGTKVDVSQAM